MQRLLFIAFLFLSILAQATTDKYRIVWSSDPATETTIGWNQIDGNNPSVYFGTIDFGTDFSQYPNNQTPDRIADDDTLFEVADAITGEFYEVSMTKGMSNHFVRLTGLQPNTKYFFVIADDNSVSPRFWFKTSPDYAGERLSILAGGDSRNNRVPRQNANLLVAKLRPDCVMFGGDMTDDDTSQEWQDWFDDWQLTISEDGRMTPIIPARGNHELLNGVVHTLFDVPIAPNQEYYANSLGGNLIRAYTLNSMLPVAGLQAQWFAADLAAQPCHYWKMTQYHFPVRPHESGKIDSEQQYLEWVPLMEQYGVQLSVECDAHVVKVTKPIISSLDFSNPTYEAGFVETTQEAGGIVYVGEGCWGAPLRDADDNKAWTAASGRFNQIKWLFVDKEKIEMRTIKTDNANDVAALTDQTRFEMPANIDLWDMDMGQTVYTLNHPNQDMPMVDLGEDREIETNETITLDAGEGFDSYNWSTGATTQTIEVEEAGTYRVTVRLGNASTGCSATDELVVRNADALPLEMLQFRGKKAGHTNSLQWLTANEIDIHYFSIERSPDGNIFESIGKVAAMGTHPAEHLYQFVDKQPLDGSTYYRLQIFDTHGDFTYSDIIRIEREKVGLEVSWVTPNPVDRMMNVQISTESQELINYEIRSISGRMLHKGIQNGNGLLQLDVQPWPSGVYFLVVEQQGRKMVQRFVKS